MDPFNSLPIEILVRILTLVQSKRTTAKFTAASPITLRTFVSNETYILIQRVAEDFDELMIQDAMFIILCPPTDGDIHLTAESPLSPLSPPFSASPHSFSTTHDSLQGFLTAWKNHRLVNPFVSGDKRLLVYLQQLHDHLLFYIEDFLTKATSIYPPRDYLCLPDRYGYLTFRGRRISKRLDAECLTSSERTRFFRFFLRSEVRERIRKFPNTLHKGNQIRRYAGRKFRKDEREAFCSLFVYKASLSCALAAHSGDFWVPDVPQRPLGGLSTTELLPPDSFFFDTRYYIPKKWPYHGLNILGQSIQAELSKWHEQDSSGSIFESWLKGPSLILPGAWDNFTGPERLCSVPDEDCPGLYAKLRPGASLRQISIYGQRAWDFLDNDRLFPKDSPFPLLPTLDDIDAEYAKAAALDEWFTNPVLAKKLRRSQTWHDQKEEEKEKDKGKS